MRPWSLVSSFCTVIVRFLLEFKTRRKEEETETLRCRNNPPPKLQTKQRGRNIAKVDWRRRKFKSHKESLEKVLAKEGYRLGRVRLGKNRGPTNPDTAGTATNGIRKRYESSTTSIPQEPISERTTRAEGSNLLFVAI